MLFTWDPAKDERNRRKHGFALKEALTAFDDPAAYTFYDSWHSEREDRFTLIGRLASGRLIALCYSIGEDAGRIISARSATRREERRYMGIDEIREGDDDDMEDIDTSHLDWSKAKRGPQFTIGRGPKTVNLDDDIRLIFCSDEEVNNALRMLIDEGRIPHFPRTKKLVIAP